jgi:hypothetical protein
MTAHAAVHAPRVWPRRLGALLAGLLATVLLSLATDVLLRATGVYPPADAPPMSDALFMLALLYRSAYGALGSVIAARLAPDRPMAHALALGFVGLAACLAGAVVTRNASDMGPRWYPIALVALALPCAWLGGKWHELRAGRAGGQAV